MKKRITDFLLMYSKTSIFSNKRNMMDMKLTVTGRWGSGKTCLLITYAHDEFPSEYVPTRIDNYVHDVTVDGKKLAVLLQDTAGAVCYLSVAKF